MMNVSCTIFGTFDKLQTLCKSIEQIAQHVQEISVPICVSQENEQLVKEFAKDIQEKHKNVHFVFFELPKDKIASMRNSVRPELYEECHARWIGLESLQKEYDYVLLLNACEIVEGSKFSKWMQTKEFERYSAVKMQNYWYFREPIYRAKDYIEDSPLIIRKGTYNKMCIFNNVGRQGIYDACVGDKLRKVPGPDKLPFIHSYDWVGNKDHIKNKVKNLGIDPSFEQKVDEEYAKPFSGTDFIRGSKYDIVYNLFDL